MPSYLSHQKLVHYSTYNYQERKIILPYNCSVDYEFCILKNHYSLRYFWKIQKYAKVLVLPHAQETFSTHFINSSTRRNSRF